MTSAQVNVGQDPLKPLLTLVQLARRAREAATREALGFVMVNETRQLLDYRQAVLWTGGVLGGQVAAVSGLPQHDGNAPYVQWLAQLCHTLEKQGGEARPVTPDEYPELAEDWAQWLPPQLLWLPLHRAQGERVIGALLLARDPAWSPHEQALARELTDGYGHALAAFAPRREWTQTLRTWLRPSPRRWKLLAAALVVCLFPVHLTVLAPAEVAPKDPFVVRSPLEGVIDQVHVRPNQPVSDGTLLVSLDSTTLRSRHDLAQKAQDAAQEEYRQAAQLAVTDDKGKLDMALRRGQLEAKEVELNYSAEQLNRVQIKAPRKGIAVFADANDWTGKAVSVGEKIMTLADPHQLELVARLPATEAIDLHPGSRVTLYPNGSPLSAYEGTVVSMAYRAEPTEEGVLAYRIKASFTDSSKLPRLGTQGTAKLYGSWVPTAYYVVRRPLTSLRQWLGW